MSYAGCHKAGYHSYRQDVIGQDTIVIGRIS